MKHAQHMKMDERPVNEMGAAMNEMRHGHLKGGKPKTAKHPTKSEQHTARGGGKMKPPRGY